MWKGGAGNTLIYRDRPLIAYGSPNSEARLSENSSANTITLGREVIVTGFYVTLAFFQGSNQGTDTLPVLTLRVNDSVTPVNCAVSISAPPYRCSSIINLTIPAEAQINILVEKEGTGGWNNGDLKWNLTYSIP